MRKYTFLLASITLLSFVSTVTATNYEPDTILDDTVYDDYNVYEEPTNCSFNFADNDGNLTCISGQPSGWNRPKSDYWQTSSAIVVVEPS